MFNIMEMRFFIGRHVIRIKHYENMVEAFTYNCLFEKSFKHLQNGC